MHIYKHLSNTQVFIYLWHVGWGADRLSSHHGRVWDATQILSIFFSGNLGKPGEPAVRQCQVTPRDVPAASQGALWHLGMEQGHLSAPFRSILLTFSFFFFFSVLQCPNVITGRKGLEHQAGPGQPLSAIGCTAQLDFCFSCIWLCCLFVCEDYRILCLYCATDNKSRATRTRIFKEVSRRECQLPSPSSTTDLLWHLQILVLF